jgi:hypothetical protein
MRTTEKHQFEHRAGKSTWCDDGRTRCAFLLSGPSVRPAQRIFSRWRRSTSSRRDCLFLCNFGRDMTDYLVSQGVKGIVLAGVCDRNTSDEALAGLRDAATKAVVVIRSSRVGSGVTRRNVEIDDDQLGS